MDAPRRAGGAIGRLAESLPAAIRAAKENPGGCGALHRVVEHDRRVLADEKARVEALKRESALVNLSSKRFASGAVGVISLLASDGAASRVLGGLASVRSGLFTGWWLNGPRVIGQRAKLRF